MIMSRYEYDIVMVLPHLGPGGTQRVASTLANAWCDEGRRVCLITTHQKPEDAYRLRPAVRRITLPRPASPVPWGRLASWITSRKLGFTSNFVGRSFLRKARSNFVRILVLILVLAKKIVRRITLISAGHTVKRILELRSVLRAMDYPIVVSFLGATNISTVLATIGSRRRVVVCERNDPARQVLNPPWQALRPWTYRLADVVTANSRGALETMSAFVPRSKPRLLPNPLVIPPKPETAEKSLPILLAVTRLVHQKGLDVLLRAFARVAAEVPDWRLDLVGDGLLRHELEEQCGVLGIADRVVFHGYTDDPFPFYYRAQIFVLPSRFEGMPNAMLEAMGCGLPVIVSDASPGPLEYAHHGVTGMVVPVEDVDALATAIREMAGNGEMRARMGAAARGKVGELRLPSVLAIWNDVLQLSDAHVVPR